MASTEQKVSEIDSASEVMEKEASLVGKPSLERDNAILTMGKNARRFMSEGKMTSSQCGMRLADQLECFRWRFRVQEHFYLAFEGLVNNRLLSLEESFYHPIDWRGRSEAVQKVYSLLKCFEIPKKCASIEHQPPVGFFEFPVSWLAIAIVRSAREPVRVFEFLHAGGFLGPLDKDSVTRMASIEFEVNPQEMACVKPWEHIPQAGFWLPQNIKETAKDMETWARGFKDRYEMLRVEYEKSYGEGTWGENEQLRDSVDGWLSGK
jgi:hypothetical protein